MSYVYYPMPTPAARAFQTGAPDAYGRLPERQISDGVGVPCRHCLKNIRQGAPYLVLAYRPFEGLHAYTETGPIFLCADECAAPEPTASLPEILDSPEYILRGYSADERIVYGTGAVVRLENFALTIARLLAMPEVAFIHIRSAKNNCYQCRVEGL